MSLATFKPSDFENITLGRKLGAGTFGTVYVGLLADGRYVAVKQLQLSDDQTGDTTEVQLHQRFSHPNIIRSLHSRVDTTGAAPVLHVYLEFVTGGSLTAIMKSLPDSKLPLPVVRVYTRHLFEGLKYLHDNGVAHRDIKGENILVSQDSGIAKLADFDQAKVAMGTLRKDVRPTKTLAGTPFWIAPEVITQEQGYDPFKADVWSAGCTVGEMVTGKAPWMPMSTPMAIMFKLANSKGWPDAIPNDVKVVGPDLHSFLDLCFQRDPEKRPGVAELLQHPYLKK